MPKSCAAYNCTNRFIKGSGITFHRFPRSDEERLKQWVCAVRRENFVPTVHTYICSKHFTPDCFYENHASMKFLKTHAVPTLFDFPEHLKKVPKTRKTPAVRGDTEKVPEPVAECQLKENIPCEHTYYISESPGKLKRKYEAIIEEQHANIVELKKKLKISKLKVARKTKKINCLKDVLKDLKSKDLINIKIATTLDENFSDLSLALLKKKTGRSYSETIKMFALSLFFYSPKAYEYCRETLMSVLPHPATIRRWYGVIDGCPGFTGEALTALKARVESLPYDINVALIFDEMSIRKHIDWDGKEFFGYVTYGANICKSQLTEAKEAFVFLVVGLNVSWSIPIAYFLTDGNIAEEKANLVIQAISILLYL